MTDDDRLDLVLGCLQPFAEFAHALRDPYPELVGRIKRIIETPASLPGDAQRLNHQLAEALFELEQAHRVARTVEAYKGRWPHPEELERPNWSCQVVRRGRGEVKVASYDGFLQTAAEPIPPVQPRVEVVKPAPVWIVLGDQGGHYRVGWHVPSRVVFLFPRKAPTA